MNMHPDSIDERGEDEDEYADENDANELSEEEPSASEHGGDEGSDFDPSLESSRRSARISSSSRARKAVSKTLKEKPSRTTVNPDIDQRPAYIHYALINYQYTISREEANELSAEERHRKMSMPIRWLVTKRRHRHSGKDQPPSLADLFVVAKGQA